MSLFPAITILKGQAINITAEYYKKENPSKEDSDMHKYTIESIDDAIEILENQKSQ